MAGTKSVFISFDYDNDRDLPGNLVAQAARSDSPFSITDRSVRAPIDENWRREVRDRIRRVDLVIVICGEHTHDADGVAGEVTITQEERKPYFLLKGAGALKSMASKLQGSLPVKGESDSVSARPRLLDG